MMIPKAMPWQTCAVTNPFNIHPCAHMLVRNLAIHGNAQNADALADYGNAPRSKRATPKK